MTNLLPIPSSTKSSSIIISPQEEVLLLLEALSLLKQKEPIHFYQPYPWQLESINALKLHIELILIAANRVGKTLTASSILAMCMIGEYPPWYNGITFDFPLRVLALGITGEQIKDVIQLTLIGEIDTDTKKFLGGGLIPLERLHSPIFDRQIPGLLREIKVKHRDGYSSKLKFRAYSQGPHVLRGPYYDLILCDEEPTGEDALAIYGEMLARIMMGNKGKGGRLILSFTPENGVTPLVDLLYNNPKKGQYLRTVGWDDAPHLNKDMKAHLLTTIPAHLIQAKTKGIPTFGSHKVFKSIEEEIMCDPFTIPDHYFILCGIDFGINHPFAACFAALDRDRNMIFVYDGFEMTNAVPAQHSARINTQSPKIPIIYPHDGISREKSGELVKDLYVTAGANMCAQFSNEDGSNHVEPGILMIDNWMREGTFKVFSNCEPFWKSYRKFRRNPTNGKLVEDGKDFMDALRYCTISIHRYGVQKTNIGKSRALKRSYPMLNL